MAVDLHIDQRIEEAINDHLEDGKAHGAPFALKGHELGEELPSLNEIEDKVEAVRGILDSALETLENHYDRNYPGFNEKSDPHPQYWKKTELYNGWPSDCFRGDNNFWKMSYEEHLQYCDATSEQHANMHGNRTWSDTAYGWNGIIHDLSDVCDSSFINKVKEYLPQTFEEGDYGSWYGEGEYGSTIDKFIEYLDTIRSNVSADLEIISSLVSELSAKAEGIKNSMDNSYSSVKSALEAEKNALDSKINDLADLKNEIEDFKNSHPLI